VLLLPFVICSVKLLSCLLQIIMIVHWFLFVFCFNFFTFCADRVQKASMRDKKIFFFPGKKKWNLWVSSLGEKSRKISLYNKIVISYQGSQNIQTSPWGWHYRSAKTKTKIEKSASFSILRTLRFIGRQKQKITKLNNFNYISLYSTFLTQIILLLLSGFCFSLFRCISIVVTFKICLKRAKTKDCIIK